MRRLDVTLLALLAAGAEDDRPGPGDKRPPRPDARTREAQRKLKEALEKEAQERRGKAPRVGQQVDKYFGTKLPPVCARLGCYLTDDGKRFYCVNASCQKHKKRETKHTRRGRPQKKQFVYFRCPRCGSRSVEMHLLSNEYACRSCKYIWER